MDNVLYITLALLSLNIIIMIGIVIYNISKEQEYKKILNETIKYIQEKDNNEDKVPQNNQREHEVKNESTENKANTSTDESNERRIKREKENTDSVFKILQLIGCNPTLKEKEGISVSYQGENFLFQFNGAFVRIWDFSWFSTKNTSDDFPLLKDAINYSNFSFGPVILMHSPDESGRIMISSRIDIFYDSDSEDNEGFIGAVLDSFFAIKHSLHNEIIRLQGDPQDRTIIVNPIGFDTASLSDPRSPQAN